MIGLFFVLPLGSQAWKVSQHLTRSAAAGQESGDADAKYRLTRRGYRWINEVPYNR